VAQARRLTVKQDVTGYRAVQRGAVHLTGAVTREVAEAERELFIDELIVLGRRDAKRWLDVEHDAGRLELVGVPADAGTQLVVLVGAELALGQRLRARQPVVERDGGGGDMAGVP
jgi:hypothetical protein